MTRPAADRAWPPIRVPDEESLAGIDVMIAGRTVWRSPRSESRAVDGLREWRVPTGLAWGLRGSGDMSIARRPDGAVVARYPVVSARGDHGPLVLEDLEGTPAIVNKWGHLVVPLSSDPQRQARMLRDTAELIEDVRAFGLRPWLMAGMLLGAVRDGDLLPSEEDGDIGYISDRTSPPDVILESYRLQRTLEAKGYTVFRQSGTHIQVDFQRDGRRDASVDIFGGFYAGDWLVQPFQVRARIPRASMEPRATAELRGVTFPIPADPEPWLVANYGTGWRVPDPAFRFVTAPESVRRLHGWFGGFIGQREVWDTFFEYVPGTGRRPSDAARRLARQRTSRPVIDLGCGDGVDSEFLARAGRRVLAVDFSRPALDLTRTRTAGLSVTLHEVNLAERRRVLEFLLDASLADADVLANRVLESMPADERENVFLLASHVVGSGGMHVGVRVRAGDRFDPRDPRTWHVERREVEGLGERHGLQSRRWREARDGFTNVVFARGKR